MTKQEAIRLHREMWSWLAKTGRGKREWPGWEWNEGKYIHCVEHCFICEYVFETLKKDPYERGVCKRYCPLKWPDGRCSLPNKKGLFNLWNQETDIEKRKEYAETIALLDEQ